MTIALVALTAITGVILAGTGGAKLVAVPDMRRRAGHLGFSTLTFRLVGALEVLGVVGLGVGLLVPPLALAAGAGLVLLLAGAVLAHVRVGDRVTEMIPAVAVGLGVVALLFLTVAR